MLTTHHYPAPVAIWVAEIREALAGVDGRKPYFVGEFGFVPLKTVHAVLNTVLHSPCSGALLWSLRSHHREGGFYVHSEPNVMGQIEGLSLAGV